MKGNPMIKQIAHICIGATNLAASERFYCDVLGLPKKFKFLKDDREFGFYVDAGGGNYIEVFSQDGVDQGSKPLIKHMCLEVESIDEAIRRISAAGVEISAKKMGTDRSWQAWITDPSGIRIELHEYTAESSQFTGRDCIVTW
jgi:glyoxylase I family protein